MRLLLTLILLIAIPVTYYFVNRILDDKGIDNKEYVMDFSEKNSGIKKLDSMDSYNAISQRPLFIESREPKNKVVKKRVRLVKPVIQDLKVQALGIALTGEGVLAVIKDLRNGKIVRLRINEEIYGWSLQGVSENSFIFVKDEQQKFVKFKE